MKLHGYLIINPDDTFTQNLRQCQNSKIHKTEYINIDNIVTTNHNNAWTVWDSTASIATATGWTVRGSNPGGGKIFYAPFQTGGGSNQASCTMGTESLPEVKWPGSGIDHTSNPS